jgi:hypothetical protein
MNEWGRYGIGIAIGGEKEAVKERVLYGQGARGEKQTEGEDGLHV